MFLRLLGQRGLSRKAIILHTRTTWSVSGGGLLINHREMERKYLEVLLTCVVTAISRIRRIPVDDFMLSFGFRLDRQLKSLICFSSSDFIHTLILFIFQNLSVGFGPSLIWITFFFLFFSVTSRTSRPFKIVFFRGFFHEKKKSFFFIHGLSSKIESLFSLRGEKKKARKKN